MKEFIREVISKVTAFIDEYRMIDTHDLVAAGVSGGADSLCLLFVLLEYRKKVPFDLIVVHVNHGIREDADRRFAGSGRRRPRHRPGRHPRPSKNESNLI